MKKHVLKKNLLNLSEKSVSPLHIRPAPSLPHCNSASQKLYSRLVTKKMGCPLPLVLHHQEEQSFSISPPPQVEEAKYLVSASKSLGASFPNPAPTQRLYPWQDRP